jgi:RNA polymerase sigma-70 factor (ECF subfamily)
MDWFTDVEVKDAIEALPDQFRVAVLLADVEGFSYKEIAEILDIPIGTVMSRLHRGRKALQKSLYEFAASRGLTERVATPSGTDGDAAGGPEPVSVGAPRAGDDPPDDPGPAAGPGPAE